MQVPGIEVPKGVERYRDLRSDDQPRDLQKSPREAIWIRHLILWERANNIPHFLLGELVAEASKLEPR
jgi:hypothetical protein